MHEKVPVSVTNVMPASIDTPLFNKSRTKIGVKPQGLPPLYSLKAVAEAILYVAEHPTRDFVVGDAGQVIFLGQRLSTQLMDTFMLLTGFSDQKTSQPKSEPRLIYLNRSQALTELREILVTRHSRVSLLGWILIRQQSGERSLLWEL